jgi:hypothetical protein
MKTMPPLPADEHDKKEGEWSGLASSYVYVSQPNPCIEYCKTGFHVWGIKALVPSKKVQFYLSIYDYKSNKLSTVWPKFVIKI